MWKPRFEMLLSKKTILPLVSGLWLILFLFLIAACSHEETTTQYGHAGKGIFGMRIEKLVEYGSKIEVVTTGAKFLLQDDGTLCTWQRIPRERETARLLLPREAWPFEVVKKDDFTYILSGNGISLTFHGDSLVILKTNRELDITFRGLFKPTYHAEKDGKWLFIDPAGGFGIYPVEEKETNTPKFNAAPWNIKYALKTGEELWFSVFPPRPYNWERAFQSLAHVSKPAYPDNDLIRSASKHNKIFTLHNGIWPGGDREPWLIPEFVPTDMEEFIRVREEVHRYGMKLVVYFSPRYSTAPDFFAEVERALDQYKVDGLYFDGVSCDFRKSYYIVRQARQVLGDDRILYIHCSTDPLSSTRIYCPFIDTYADYILRGEATRSGFESEDFLRWTVSGYNISNAVGYAKLGDKLEPPTNEEIAAILRNKARHRWWYVV